MRLLILSDLHASPRALASVLDAAGPWDEALCCGDMVSYGPDPESTVRWVHDHCRWVVSGNHDHALAHEADPQCKLEWHPWALATLEQHRRLLPPDLVDWLGALPTRLTFDVQGTRFLAGHASPMGDLTGYRTPDDVCRLARHAGADVVVTGHTHEQWYRAKTDMACINPGSVGLPRSLAQACAALWEDGTVTLVRAPLHWQETLQDLAAGGIPQPILKLAGSLMSHVGTL